jgi:CubicO group peptidase (beta-lactamase class C family)
MGVDDRGKPTHARAAERVEQDRNGSGAGRWHCGNGYRRRRLPGGRGRCGHAVERLLATRLIAACRDRNGTPRRDGRRRGREPRPSDTSRCPCGTLDDRVIDFDWFELDGLEVVGVHGRSVRIVTIDGYAATEFEPVVDAFSQNFDVRGEVGAAVCVYVDGQPVVDVWGGLADATTGAPWREDTIVLVYSSTKGVTSVCANVMIERGLLEPDGRVATIWPEFARNGKDVVTVGQVLSHQAGLPYVDQTLTLDEALQWEPPVAALAAQAPIWEPGTAHGYHMRTFGWLVGELVRRADPQHRTIGRWFREEIAEPLGLDFWIGLPEALEPRLARLVPPKTDLREALRAFGDDLLLARVFSNPGGHFNYDDMWNTRPLHAAELPSSNGIGDARSLARLYAALIGDVDGRRVLRPDTLAAATTERACGTDEVLMIQTCFGLGFMLGRSFGNANPPHAVGHAGAGGSLAFGDPARGIAFGYVMNDLRFDPAGDPRSEALVRAIYACC